MSHADDTRGEKMKRLTVDDATKEELIQYFFQPEGFGGGYRIPAMVDQFLIWLQQKRTGELITAQEQTIDASQKALHEYIQFVKEANEEPDIDRKLTLFEKANKAYDRYEKANKAYDRLDKKIMQSM